jgi:hypothetical protein
LLRCEEIDGSFQMRLWHKVSPGEEDECWEWTGAKQSMGYGMIRLTAGRPVLAHCAMFVIATGEDLFKKDEVLHACDNPGCVNPNHLSKGSHADNLADAVRKGRMSSGDEHRKKVLAGLGGNWRSGKTHGAAVREGLHRAGMVGETHVGAKLSDADVLKIRQLKKDGWTCRKIGHHFGVSNTHVSAILTGKRRNAK